jgi:hypothetical protein
MTRPVWELLSIAQVQSANTYALSNSLWIADWVVTLPAAHFCPRIKTLIETQ